MVPQGPSPSNAPLPQSVELQALPAHARAAPEIAGELLDLLGLPLAEWGRHGFAPTKERTVRTVLRGTLAGVPVHLKVFRADTLSDRARDALRGPRGAREHDSLARARALGLPAVEPLAHGLLRDGDALRSFVVTRTVHGGRPFDFGMAPAAQRAAGALLRRLHDAGVVPGDLHPGNLLIDDVGSAWLLDLASLRHAGEVSTTRRAAALALFCHELDAGALDPRAREVLGAYLAAGPVLPERFRGDLAAATRRWRADALPAFGRRCARTCRHTEVGERRRGEPRWCWHLAGPGEDPAVRARCAELAASPPPADKSGRRGGVWLVDGLVMKDRDGGAAKKLWRAAYWLEYAGVPTPAAVALRLWRGRGQVFAERWANPSLADELASGALGRADLFAAARSLGNAVGRLHAHGLRNRDLKLENLVRHPTTRAVGMVDLDGVSRKSAIDTRGTGVDLGRLLAAFRGAGCPGGTAVIRVFLRAWLRAHRALLQSPPVARILRVAALRAGEWASAHREPA